MNAPASAGASCAGAKAGGKRDRERDGSEKTCHWSCSFVRAGQSGAALNLTLARPERNTGRERIIACIRLRAALRRTSLMPTRTRHGSAESHAALVSGRALRRRDRRGAHVLFAAGHRAQRNHRQTARFDRSADLRRRAPHGLPARAFRVRTRKHFAPAGVERPALVPVLQLRAVESALRQAERAARLRAADHGRSARRLRAGRARRVGCVLEDSRRCSRTMRGRS